MDQSLRIALWNANGLTQHQEELQIFITNNKIDILLISETHFTSRNFMRIPRYDIYDTKHPSGRAHGGTAIIIKRSIKHHELQKYDKDYLQATSIVIEDWCGPLTLSAVYCPPKHSIKQNQFEDFFNTLGARFIAGGDYNAKHHYWGSRLITTKGKNLYNTVRSNKYEYISTGEPTYWPTDRNKIPDLIDFCVTKGITQNYLLAESNLDLSSDHSPVIITISTHIILKSHPPTLYNRHTNWIQFREHLSIIPTDVPLKTEYDIDEAVELLTCAIQDAAWQATPESNQGTKTENVPLHVREKIREKRRLRKIWQSTRQPSDKNKLNTATRNLKNLLQRLKDESIQNYLEGLCATEATDYSLWKATKRIGRPIKPIPPIRKENGEWARSDAEKAATFANHLAKVFQPYPQEITDEEETEIRDYLEAPFQMSPPIKKITIAEVKTTINNHTDPKKKHRAMS